MAVKKLTGRGGTGSFDPGITSVRKNHPPGSESKGITRVNRAVPKGATPLPSQQGITS